MPEISCILAVYNDGPYLEAAVQSVLDQTFGDFELVIVDDGSTDGSPDILAKLAGKDDRIRVITQENKGLAAALNVGIRHSTGRLIARMDGDDFSLPNRFEVQREFLDEHRDVVAVGGRVLMIDDGGRPLGDWDFYETHEEIDAFHMTGRGGGIVHPAAMMRRDAVEQVGLYRENFVASQDYDLWLRLAEIGRLQNLDAYVLHFRRHLRSISFRNPGLQLSLTDLALNEAIDRRGLKKEELATKPTQQAEISDLGVVHRYWAQVAIRNRYYSTALFHAWRSWRYRPSDLTRLRLIFGVLLYRLGLGRLGVRFSRALRKLRGVRTAIVQL